VKTPTAWRTDARRVPGRLTRLFEPVDFPTFYDPNLPERIPDGEQNKFVVTNNWWWASLLNSSGALRRDETGHIRDCGGAFPAGSRTLAVTPPHPRLHHRADGQALTFPYDGTTSDEPFDGSAIPTTTY